MHALSAPTARRAGWRDWALAGAAALSLHGMLLGGRTVVGPTQRSQPAAQIIAPDGRRTALAVVRRVELARATVPMPMPPIATPTPTPTAAARPAPPAPRVRPRAAAEDPTSTRTARAGRDVAPPAAHAEAPPPAPRAEAPPPVYRTRLPPGFRLAFELHRGATAGTAELVFEPGPESYAMRLDTQLPGRDAMALSSRGRLGAHGLEPERLVDRRRGRDRHAVNFDHAQGRISYSGPRGMHELLPGAQDRLSWMAQLPAIVDADPQAFGRGAAVHLQVAGTRGDAAVWTFAVRGDVVVEAPDGTARRLLHLAREPAHPYDARVEVWLDPLRHHLPARIRVTHPPGDGMLELRAPPAASAAAP